MKIDSQIQCEMRNQSLVWTQARIEIQKQDCFQFQMKDVKLLSHFGIQSQALIIAPLQSQNQIQDPENTAFQNSESESKSGYKPRWKICKHLYKHENQTQNWIQIHHQILSIQLTKTRISK